MGTIKDLADLVSQLSKSVQDRKFATELRQIQGMIGSIQSEHAAIHEQRIELMTENAELKQTIASLQQQIADLKTPQTDVEHDLDEEPRNILMFLVRAREAVAEQIAQGIHIDLVRVEYWLGLLSTKELINTASSVIAPAIYSLSQKGRGYLITKGLI